MASPTEQLNQDLAKKRGARLGGRRTDQFAPGEDVGYIEYDGQSPDIGNAVAAYDGTSEPMMEPQQGSGFAGTAMDSLVEPEPAAPRQTPVMQASMQGDDGEVIQTGCPGGVCETGNASAAPQLFGDDTAVTPPAQPENAEGEASDSGEQPQAQPDYSLASSVKVFQIPISDPVTGQSIGGIPVLDTAGLAKFVDAQSALASQARQRKDAAGFFQHMSLAKEGMAYIGKTQAISAAAFSLATTLSAEHEELVRSSPEYGFNKLQEIFSRPNVTAAEAAYEATEYQTANFAKSAESGVENLPTWDELYASNLQRAHARKFSQVVQAMSGSVEGDTPDVIREKKEQGLKMLTNQLLDFYNPIAEQLRKDGVSPDRIFDRNVMYKAIRDGLGPHLTAEFADYAMKQNPGLDKNQALLAGASMASKWLSAGTGDLHKAYEAQGAFSSVPKTVLGRPMVPEANQADQPALPNASKSLTAQAEENAAQGVAEAQSFLSQVNEYGMAIANKVVTEPVDFVRYGSYSPWNWDMWKQAPQPQQPAEQESK